MCRNSVQNLQSTPKIFSRVRTPAQAMRCSRLVCHTRANLVRPRNHPQSAAAGVAFVYCAAEEGNTRRDVLDTLPQLPDAR
jgi:hypothetical protein